MGQEIVYCFKCSNRIIGAEVDKGSAVQIGNRTCCAQCLPTVMAELPEAQRQTLLKELSRGAPTRNTPRGGTEISSTKTSRAVPLASPSPGEGKPPLVAIGVAVGAVVLGVILFMVLSGSPSENAARRDPGPGDPPPPSRPEVPERDKNARLAIDRARDAARSGIDIDLQVRLWEEAVTKSERTSFLDEATQERTAILARRKEVYAQELAKLTDSVEGMVRQEETKRGLELLISARKRHDLPEWSQAIDLKIEELKKAEAAGVPYRQGTEADGLVCMEAERCHVKTEFGGHAWTLVTAPAGFEGKGAMSPLPNNGGGAVSNYAATSPRMDYRIQFVKAGKYTLWVRAWAADGTDDSVHAGLDGKEVKTLAAIPIPIKKWGWVTKTMGNAPATFEIPAPGLHTVNLWMREDGAVIDRILVTTNAKYVPKDAGPPESPR